VSHEAADQTNDAPTDQPAGGRDGDGDRANDAASEAEFRALRAQVARLKAERDLDRALFRAEVTRIETARDRELAEYAALVETLKANANAHALLPGAQVVGPATDAVSPGRVSPELAAQDASDLGADIADMRSALVSSVQQVNAKLPARPSLPVRTGLVLLQGWCIAGGLYMVAFVNFSGAEEVLTFGRRAFAHLYRDILALWPL